MVLPDVNVLVAALVDTHPHGSVIRPWFDRLLKGPSFAMSDLVLTGFVRLVTRVKFSSSKISAATALDACNTIRQRPNCTLIRPGSAHWMLFEQLCRKGNLSGNLIADAWFAALAIENGCTWATLDGDFSKFSGLTWQHLPNTQIITNP